VAPASSAVQLPLALVADQLSLFEPSPETLTGPAWRARLREALARGTWPALASGRRCVVVARL
jgi:hypothetical protein